MNKVMFEVMRYFGLSPKHRPSSGVKWKLIELLVTFTLESQIKLILNMKWVDVSNKVKHREYSREVSNKVDVHWEKLLPKYS